MMSQYTHKLRGGHDISTGSGGPEDQSPLGGGGDTQIAIEKQVRLFSKGSKARSKGTGIVSNESGQ